MSIAVISAEVMNSITERRKFPRYRYSTPISIRLANAPLVRGMTVEISESGLSAVLSTVLQPGAEVELEPVAGFAAEAVVRRNAGRFCGFEFLGLTPDQLRRIRDTCAMLPLYYSQTLDLWQRPEDTTMQMSKNEL